MVAPLIISRTRAEAGPGRPHGSVGCSASPVDSEFAHMLAHDLRSPLTAIQMSADALFAGTEAAARERYAALIAEQARSIAWSLEDLVALADCEAWRAAPRRAVDLSALAERCLAELAGLAEARGLRLLAGPASEDDVCAWGVEPALHLAARGCARAILGAAPPGTQVAASAQRAETTGPDRGAALTIRGRHPDPARGLGAIALPWHRTPLLAAARIAHEHGGALRELREEDAFGLELTLPTSPAEQ